MGLKQIFNQASQFQNNAGAQGMNLSAMPIGLNLLRSLRNGGTTRVSIA